MSFKKLMKGVPADWLPAEGLWSLDRDAVTPCQIECVNRLGKTLQIEQENYLLRHNEVQKCGHHKNLPVYQFLEIDKERIDEFTLGDFQILIKMSFKKLMKGVPADWLPAEGLWSLDRDAVTPCQIECVNRLGKTLQIEQENYLLRHNEVKVMLELFISKMAQKMKRKDILKEAAEYFTRPIEEIEQEINKQGYSHTVPRLYEDADLEDDIRDMITTHYKTLPPKPSSPSASTLNTQSSSFISIKTSDTTLPTPEPIPTPPPTLSETLFMMVSNTVDKAIFLRVDDTILNYDTAYIELKKAVEKAMDIPVTDIKKDIADLFNGAYEMFEFNIMEKERILAEIAWERRMRKKMKKTLRRLDNFKGYETPSTPRSMISSHESYKIPPPRPCICHPQFNFNRYPKDRFGIYLPREKKFHTGNITVTPAISESSEDGGSDKKSVNS